MRWRAVAGADEPADAGSRRTYPAHVLTVLLASFLGCSALYGPSADEFSSGRADGGGGSSGTGGEGGAGTGDGGTNLGPDGGPPDGTFTCPANALLCDDFERDTVLGVFVQAENQVSISRAQAHSPSRSLAALLRSGEPSAYVASEFEPPPKMRLSFWFYAATAPPAYRVRLAQMLYGPGCDWDLSWTITLSDAGLTTGTDAYDAVTRPGCGPFDGQSAALLTPGETFVPRWHRVIATFDVSAQLRTVDIQIDERPVVHTEVRSKRSGIPDGVGFAVGVPCVQENGGCFEWDRDSYTVFVDDVIVAPL